MKSKEAKQRQQIFLNTLDMIRSDKSLSEAVEASIEDLSVYGENEYPRLADNIKVKNTVISVTEHRSFEAAALIHEKAPDRRIAVLNFANAFCAGGGVKDGASAQEECLCRESTLFPVLDTPKAFKYYYKYNRCRADYKALDNVIYSPDIIVFKDDKDFPQNLPEDKRFKVDVITCAAPDLRAPFKVEFPNQIPYMSEAEQFALHVKRAVHILSIAAYKGAESLVLGAFGCGVFNNNPETVAKAYKTAIDVFPKYFDEIEFAVYCRDDKTNYQEFLKVFG
jgi:uncharacterized protein (TIGR02452 family)